MIHIVRFFTRRLPNEGPRFGTVRRPPRGVPKADYTKLNVYDVWFPNLAPSAELIASFKDEGMAWEGFRRKFIAEMRQSEPSRVLDVFAKLSHQTNFAIGCYCNDEGRCHRSILRELLKERGAKLSPYLRDVGIPLVDADDPVGSKEAAELVEFHNEKDADAHGKFQHWRRSTDNGLFINVKSENNAMLHRVLCAHSGDTDWEEGEGGSLTNTLKVCSTNREGLLNWASTRGMKIKICRHCKP